MRWTKGLVLAGAVLALAAAAHAEVVTRDAEYQQGETTDKKSWADMLKLFKKVLQ